MSDMPLINYQQLVQQAKQQIQEINVDSLYQLQDKQHAIIIDIRETDESNAGVIEDAICIPRGILEANLINIAVIKDQPDPLLALSEYDLYLYCRSGARSALAAQSLQAMGLNSVFSVAGGILAWQEKGYRLTTKEDK
ncbi:rhodanese-like domain-containing protein [Neptunicella sp. SCSIO 80796]|uniref:rhodanese-like domain-containing protein n=1 Tax=Neptunicella plasticusilytica TaxID=3117012 RepID=UPI003A4E56BB